jgi:transcriptional antiterminator NusG
MAQHWYVVHVYSGFEKKVAESIRAQADATGMESSFRAMYWRGWT